MITSSYFEICSVILLEKEKNITTAAEKIERTINSLLNQEKKPCKIVIMDVNCDIKQDKIRAWMKEISPQIYDNGVQDFKYHVMLNEENDFKQNLIVLHKTFIDKPLGIRIKTSGGDRKSKLRVNHFAIISAGSIYGTNRFYSKASDMFLGNSKCKTKSLIYFSNIIVDENCLDIKKHELIDKSPCIYFSQGFRHFIDPKTKTTMIDTYREIDKGRDKMANTLNSQVKTRVFSKIKDSVICCGGVENE